MKTSQAYGKLALIYSHVMKRVHYDDWADYIYSITKNYMDRGGRVLELAAGNCSLANYLVKYFPNIIATDYSKDMLFSDNKQLLNKVCCDMTKLPFKKSFNLVYSAFDSVNYLTTSAKVFSLFTEVNSILSGNGVFTFDVSLERNSYVHIQQPVRKGCYNNINYVHTTMYDEKKRTHKNIFKIELQDGTKYREIHKQKIYPFEHYFILLEKAGLYVINCFEGFTFKNAKPTSVRAQFVVGKMG